MVRKQRLAHRSNYGSSRAPSTIKFIVIHYTANDGDTDENNGNYFANNVTKTSAHYFVDDDSMTQTVPDNYIAYHCGTTGTYKHIACRNSNSIGIEICDDVKNGVIYPSEKTIANVIQLTKELMAKYDIIPERVIRHFDVTGKACPAYWVDDAKWEKEFHSKLIDAELENAKRKIRQAAGLAEKTIKYLEDYTYGRDLILKLAKGMK